MPLMQQFKNFYGNPVGFSDHTNGTHIACTAVAMGAQVIEKHFTLDRKLGTPDSNSFACDPAELKLLVTQIREIERAMLFVNDRQQIQDEEQTFKKQILYKCIANKNKNADQNQPKRSCSKHKR